MPKQRQAAKFQHRQSEECSCPIHSNGREPFTAPLGYRFADDISVESISREQAEQIYQSHHQYRQDVPSINIAHHGIKYQDEIVGAITWRTGLGGGGGRALRWDDQGSLLPRVFSDRDYQSLPGEIRYRAKEIVPDISESQVAERRVVGGDKFINADRICVGVSMPNLASAALARSQERIVESYCKQNGVEYLLTFVRADYRGSMILALGDKGWLCTGWSEPSTPGNREHEEIHDRYKWRFICPVKKVTEQATLSEWEVVNYAEA